MLPSLTKNHQDHWFLLKALGIPIDLHLWTGILEGEHAKKRMSYVVLSLEAGMINPEFASFFHHVVWHTHMC